MMERAKAHPIFPVIDYIAKKVYASHQLVVGLDAKISSVQGEIDKLRNGQDDVKDLVKEEARSQFKIKKSPYEVLCI